MQTGIQVSADTLAVSLSALRQVTDRLTAIVTVADNGGSSGRLRDDFNCLPPGDLRMALAALCRDDDWGRTWAEVLQHRFSAGQLEGHAVGNLLIVALWDLLGDTVEGLEWVGALLGAQGRVLPMSSVPLDITAKVQGDDVRNPDEITTVRGQVQVAKTAGRVLSVALDPPKPPASPAAVAAVDQADWVVVGPGSWFTSVLPNLLVPDLAAALQRTEAKKLLVVNLGEQVGETDGFDPETHLDVLAEHAPDLHLDVVLADSQHIPNVGHLEDAAAAMGAELVVADIAEDTASLRHDPEALTKVYRSLLI